SRLGIGASFTSWRLPPNLRAFKLDFHSPCKEKYVGYIATSGRALDPHQKASALNQLFQFLFCSEQRRVGSIRRRRTNKEDFGQRDILPVQLSSNCYVAADEAGTGYHQGIAAVRCAR